MTVTTTSLHFMFVCVRPTSFPWLTVLRAILCNLLGPKFLVCLYFHQVGCRWLGQNCREERSIITGACGYPIYSTVCYGPAVQQYKPLTDLQWWNTWCMTSWAAPPNCVPSWVPACWSKAMTENRWSSAEQKWRYIKFYNGREKIVCIEVIIDEKSQRNCDGSPIHYVAKGDVWIIHIIKYPLNVDEKMWNFTISQKIQVADLELMRRRVECTIPKQPKLISS